MDIESTEQSLEFNSNMIKLFYIFIINKSEMHCDYEIIEQLNISHDDYVKILKQYGAIQSQCDAEYYFKRKKDARSCINSKELEPYLIMFELTK